MKRPTLLLLLPLLSAFALSPGQAGTMQSNSVLRSVGSEGIQAVVAMLQADGAETRVEVEDSSLPVPGPGDPLVVLGSITKFVTAVTVLHLVDEGLLDLDMPLGEVFPAAPGDKAAITLHQLLTHTSGLTESTGDDGERIDREGFLERVLARPLVHGPGETYLYSNAGYSLLAAIVEVVSGKTYEAYLLKEVLGPRDLPPIGYQAAYESERSMLSSRDWRTLFRREPIHEASWGGAAPGWNLIGNGGAVATAEGFLRFWHAFLQGRIVSPDLVRLALTPHADEGEGRSYYGYGLVVEQSPEVGTVYWHDGGNQVFSAEWLHLREQGTTFFAAGPGESAFEAMDVIREAMARR